VSHIGIPSAAGVRKVEVRSRSSGKAHFFQHSSQNLLTAAARRFKGRVSEVVPDAAAEELQLFSESENCPRQPARQVLKGE